MKRITVSDNWLFPCQILELVSKENAGEQGINYLPSTCIYNHLNNQLTYMTAETSSCINHIFTKRPNLTSKAAADTSLFEKCHYSLPHRL